MTGLERNIETIATILAITPTSEAVEALSQLIHMASGALASLAGKEVAYSVVDHAAVIVAGGAK